MTEQAPQVPSYEPYSPTDPAPSVFISNVEATFGAGQAATGAGALKCQQISGRALAYPYDTVVLPEQPDPDFVEYYGNELNRRPRIIIPTGINLEQLDITDGFDDPDLKQAVAGAAVHSYVADSRLHQYVTDNGGRYRWGDPDRPISEQQRDRFYGTTLGQVVNDKANFRELAIGLIEPPEGELAIGLSAIAAAVGRRLDQDGTAFVRHTVAAGGLGNARFDSREHGHDSDTIIERLTAKHPDLWDSTKAAPKALVEKYQPPDYSPAITFRVNPDGSGDMLYHSLQLTRRNDYVGMATPTPSTILDIHRAEQMASGMAGRLAAIGYQQEVGLDMGESAGRLDGYELNCRMTGSMHPVFLSEHILQAPWRELASQRIVTWAVDRFILSRVMSFEELHDRLQQDPSVHLANYGEPFGVAITIPPVEDSQVSIAGIQIITQGHRQASQMLRRVIQAVGDDHLNRFDNNAMLNGELE